MNQENDNVGLLFETEAAIKNGCKNFKAALHNMATFGGEEVVEF